MTRLAETILRFTSPLPAIFALFALAVVALQATPALAEPEVTEINLQQGDVLNEPPEVVHMCFSEPVRLTSNPDGSTPAPDEEDRWRFNMTTPDGIGLGLRIVFEPSGECVDIHPGLPEDAPEGTWTFDWMVTAQEDGEQASDLITFAVGSESPSSDAGSGAGSDSDGLSTLEMVLIAIASVSVVAAVAGFGIQFVRRRRTSSRS